jgi:PiT family inorganic phosphate transporter
MDHHLIYILLAAILGLCVTWSVGANDLANVMSTAIGSKAVTTRQAILIAIIFEFAGALLGGHGVAVTISNGIIKTNLLTNTPFILADGMLAVLLAAATWLTLASIVGMPVSVTQTIVGSIFGFGIIILGIHAIHWQQIIYILISWVASPTLAGLISYLLFMSIQYLILATVTPLKNAKRYTPIYLFLVGFILSVITVIKGLKHFGLELHFFSEFLIALLSGIVILSIGLVALRHVDEKKTLPPRLQFIYIEKMFAILMVLTACAMVFAHGSNDVAIAVGPVAAIVDLFWRGELTQHSGLLYGILFGGCVGVLIGLLMYGRKVIATVGSGITALTPSRAFCATLAAATTVVVSTSIGIPVSATQTLVGAVLGVGLARGIGALDLGIIRNIFLSWMVTLPVGAALTIGFYLMFRRLL